MEKSFELCGDFETRNPHDMNLRNMRDGVLQDEYVLDLDHRR